MTGDISAAQQKADEAFQDAADADSKAATAQAKADLADDKAQAILKASNSIVPNGDFENTSPNIWPNTTYQTGISVVEADHARSGTHVMRVDSTSANRYPLTDWRSSGEGRIYYAEVWVYHNDTDMTQRGRVSFYANSEFKDGSTTGYYGQYLDGGYVYVYQDEMTPGVWNKVSAYITAPEGTVNIRVAPHVLRNETPFDLDDFKVIDVTESIAALREANQAKSDAVTAQTKANEAKSAADAAQTAASNAQSTATEALTSANSKNTVTRSTANPTTPYAGRVDDIWWKMSTLSSGGRVIAQYRWSGTAWLTETIDNAVIANLDAAKITTGYLDAARIKANTLNADTVLINGSLGSIILRDGAITTPKIAVGAITAESGVVASLDAGKITVGTLDAARIAANSITADKVLLGSGANLAPWDQVSGGRSAEPHRIYQTSDGTVSLGEAIPDRNIPAYLKWTRTSGQTGGYGPVLTSRPGFAIPVEPSKTYTVRVKLFSDNLTCNAGMRVYQYTSTDSFAGGYIASTQTTHQPLGPGLVEHVLQVTTRSNCFQLMPMIQTSGNIDDRYGDVGVVDWSIKETVGATLIEPGAITTEKLATGAITAESGVIGSLDASKITVGKLSGARLEADAINGMQIIGATIATSTSFPRVQLDNAGLAVYKSSSVRSFFADASSGDLSIVGDFATATAGNERVFLSNTLWNSIQIVDDTGTVVGTTAGSGIRVGPGDQGTLDLYHGGRLAPSGSYVDVGIMKGPRSAAQPNGASVSVNKTTLPDGSEFNWAALTATNRSGRVVGRVGTSASGPHTFIESDGKIQMSASKGGFSIETDIGSIRTDSKYPRIEFEAPKMMFLAPEPAEPTNPSLSYLEFLFDSHTKHSGTYISSSTQRNGTPRPITIGGWTGTNYVKVDSDIVTLGAQGRVVIDNYFSPVAEFNYGQGNASWNVSFKKAGTDWGYVGSTSGMGVNDFGIQSAAGKRLVLNAGTGSAKITLGTDGSITGLPIATGDGVSFPTVAANGGSQTVTIKFPSGKFNVAPSVSAMTSHGRVTPVVFNITKTGFSFRVWNFTSSSATSVVGTWIAVAAS